MLPRLRHAPDPAAATPQLAPWGTGGPFGRELDCDVSGPALAATVEYRLREGVAAQSSLRLVAHRARSRCCLGYGGTLLAQLVPMPHGERGQQLRLTDLTQQLPPSGQPCAPHIQRLGFGLTNATPGDLGAAVAAESVTLASFVGMSRERIELLRAEFLPGDQRPQALVYREQLFWRATDPNRPPQPRYNVYWLDLAPLWQKYPAGVVLDVAEMHPQRLAEKVQWPQVFTNMGGGDDAGRTFVLAEGEDDDLRAFGAFPNKEVVRLRIFSPPPGAGRTPPACTFDLPLKEPAWLSGVACAPHGVAAWCLDGNTTVTAAKARGDVRQIEVPIPAALVAATTLGACNLQFAAGGTLFTNTLRGDVPQGDGTEVLLTRAGLFALDFLAGAARPLKVPQVAGVNPHYTSLCFAKTDLCELDVARVLHLDEAKAKDFGGRRFVRAIRRLFLPEKNRVPIYVGAMFANTTQLWRLEFNPFAPSAAAAEGGYKVVNLAQSFSFRRKPYYEADILWEHNDVFEGQIYASGSPRLLLSLDKRRWLMPRFYGEVDQERDNGRLSGGVKYLALAETRPEVVEAAAALQLELTANKVTLGPWMSRDGRWLFAGFDNNRLHRWDFAPEENGWLKPGTHEPVLQPAYERARTANFMVTPFSRHAKADFLGHRSADPNVPRGNVPPRPGLHANLFLPVPALPVDPWPAAVDQTLKRVDHPRPPQLMDQVVGFGLTRETPQAQIWAERAPPQDVDLPSWGSADHDLAEAAATGQTKIRTEPEPFNRYEFDQTAPPPERAFNLPDLLGGITG